MEQVRLKIIGRVQGVFFRAETREKTLSLGLTGWVKNTPDGNVEILAKGPRAKLEQLIEWCKKGPDSASVSEVKIIWEKPAKAQKIANSFEIRY